MIPILYSDEHVVAVAKPAGLFVHPSDLDPRAPALLGMLRDQVGRWLYPIHRLDRPTSGLVLFGLSPAAAAAFHDALKAPSTTKEYLGLARGVLPLSGTICRDLTSRDGSRRLFSRTDYVRLAVLERCSLLSLFPRTGRRHQIRRHLAGLAHQLLGDTTYSKGRTNAWFRERYGLPRLALHARRLEIDHPFTRERLRIEAPVAEDLLAFLERLPGFAAVADRVR